MWFQLFKFGLSAKSNGVTVFFYQNCHEGKYIKVKRASTVVLN